MDEEKPNHVWPWQKRAKEMEDAYMEHVKQEIVDRLETGEPMTIVEYNGLRMNSYERQLLFPLLEDSAFLELAQYYYDNSGFRPMYQYDLPNSYTDAVTGIILPMLIERMRKNTT